MAIGTTLAIAGLGAAAGIGGALIGSSSQKKAAKSAANAQTQTAAQNNALAREFQAKNQANLQPWLNSGMQANSLVNSFLYGPQQQAPQAATQQFGAPQAQMGQNMIGPRYGIAALRGMVGDGHGINAPQPGMVTTAAQPQQQQPQGQSGYDAFVASPYYQNPLREGMNALNHGLASRGMLESGGAAKAAIRFGQDYAHGRQGEFIGMAERQSDRGLQAGGAIAGVGMNALSAQTANNQNAANALSNAAIARGNATAGMWGTIGSSLGGIAGSLIAPSSYGNYAPGTYAGPINVTGYR